ncbi:unnamed protein product [Parajaminaea phylloscopi]
MSKLNYSKWDNLELSDDSDVEVHPNVDKKSFIRWKQRDIHEKREQRKEDIRALRTEKDTNAILAPLLAELLDKTRSEGHLFYSRETSRLTSDRAERGNKDGPNGPTPNDMILSLLLQINEEPNVKGKQGAELDNALVESLDTHNSKLQQRSTQLTEQIRAMEQEDAKKITSDGLRDGFNSGHVSRREADEEEPSTRGEGSSKAKAAPTSTRTTHIETLNSPASAPAPTSQTSAAQVDEADEADDEEDVPDLTPMMKAFGLLPSCIPAMVPLSSEALPASFTPKHLDGRPFSAALDFLSGHKQLLRSGATTTDAMLVEAFQSQMRGEAERSRKFVEKALMVQYLGKLGPDGVNLFFRRMASPDGKAAVVFLNDVLSTYVRITKRCEALSQEKDSGTSSTGQEQIQLVAEDPSTVISFEVPEGPAPDKIELEGEAAEQLDPERVKEFLNKRWEIFSSFDAEFQEALKSKSLQQVNEVLGKMEVSKAEDIVARLDEAGILNFSSSEVRDETGN